MSTTTNIGLTLTTSDSEKTFQTWRLELAGDSNTSNMVIIDTEIGKLNTNVSELQSTSKTNSDDINTLEESVSSLKESNSSTKDTLNEIQQELTNVGYNVSSNQDRIRFCEADIAELRTQQNNTNSIIWSAEQPTTQTEDGDTWNEIIS